MYTGTMKELGIFMRLSMSKFKVLGFKLILLKYIWSHVSLFRTTVSNIFLLYQMSIFIMRFSLLISLIVVLLCF